MQLQKFAVMALALGTALTLQAQGPDGPGGPHGPGGPGFGPGPRMGFRPGGPGPLGFGGPLVTNQPYADTETTTDTRTRKDGKSVTHAFTEQKWRDASGRTRIELSAPAEGKHPAIHRAEIVDPVAHTATSLDFNRKVAIVRQLPQPRNGNRRQPPPDGAQRPPRPERPGITVTETDLPGKQIAGIYATGKQITRTIAPGTHGNTEAITQTSEQYISPDLKILLYSSETGPRNSMVHQVTELTRVDPDTALFSVPTGFTVRDAPRRGFRGPRGPRGPGRPEGPAGPGAPDGPPPPAGE